MIRRGWTALIVTAMGLGLFAAHTGVHVHAASAFSITNIGVAVDGSGNVSYGICVVAAAPPSSGTVTVEGPITSTTLVRAAFTDSDQSCGDYNGTAYFMHATFSPPLAAGSYTFRAAEVDEPDGSGTTLGRYSGFTSNFAGDRVWNSCIVDFNTGTPSPVQNCNPPTGGVVGNLTSVVLSPPPVPTATRVPTSTRVPTATMTPVPTATTTPVPPTATQGNASPGTTPTTTPTRTPQATVTSAAPSTPIGTAPPTNTPVTFVVVSTEGVATATPTATSPPTATSTAASHDSSPTHPHVGHPAQNRTSPSSIPTPSSDPPLRVTLLEPLVQPGAMQHIAVSYVADALVQATVTFPGAPAALLTTITGAHGRVTLAVRVPLTVTLRNGRATAQITVRASAGAWHRVTTLAPLMQPGATRRLSIVSTPYTSLRAVVTIPGVRPFSLVGTTDGRGRLTFTVTAPRHVTLSHGRVTALVAVSAVSEQRYAWVTRVLSISDMMLSVASGRIMNCVQTASVHVAYHPNVPLRMVLLFPHGRHLTVSTRTDPHGNATVRARLTYVRADSPVRIGVQASDATAGAQRMESTAVSVELPQACQKAPGATVTIGD